MAQRAVARPAHHRREHVPRPALGRPLREQDRLPRRPPVDAVREGRLTDALAEAEEDVVRRETPLERLLAAWQRELDLRESRVRVDVGETGNLRVLPRANERPRDVDAE